MIDPNTLKVGDVLYHASDTVEQVRVKHVIAGREGTTIWVVPVVSSDYDPSSFNPSLCHLFVLERAALQHAIWAVRAKIAQANVRLFGLQERLADLCTAHPSTAAPAPEDP